MSQAPTFALPLLTGAISLAAGASLGLLCARQSQSHRLEVLAFAALGLLAGSLIGLSTSPVVGAAVAAGLSLAGTALSRHAEKIKGSPGVPTRIWLPPLALMALVGILAGICIRGNDLLHFAREDLREHYTSLGFNPAQVDRIMDRLAGVVTWANTTPVTNSNLLREEGELGWASLAKMRLSDDELIQLLAKEGTEPMREGIRKMQGEQKSNAEIVRWIREKLEPTKNSPTLP